MVVMIVALSTVDVVEKAKEIVTPWKGQRGGLIPILQEMQKEFGYLPEEALLTVSKELKIPKAEVYGVATFYAQFHLKPRGRHVIRVCRGTACHVRGSLQILEKVKQMLGIEENETTDDLRFTLEPVACLGACGLAPVMMVDEDTHGRLTPDKIKTILEKYK
ncbi:MAG: NADH-quinone oxidoreductase subunit NuoE [Acetomicrobium sp.]|uniref:NADH-quinone oxidoreductase subunit NuoE n=2 Tax=Acetomicrobiaceae TaxID=3029086 RepID=UPI00168FBBD5|nr:NADH-quinone oxidoreductase subunit NuoE [Synergistota bacterium]NLI42707.1 NADH-quinone oxidoreductase subunit NuoE [Synergistaceae bacterium]HOM98159.1 NADH-quinone oxidoreductase subunit NuoE [Acetomicrobium sp.]HQA36018.1 NADH-quinone oxidoreductase subunit NuoE [Acetomicrobium sp.]HQC87672.1 NADH-quinone oxidoreductase subunit NuoE [Acetomicrobium sp.]